MPERFLDLPPLPDRIAAARPLFTREQAYALSKKVLNLITARSQSLTIQVTHTVCSVTRITTDRVRAAEEGERLTIQVSSYYPPRYLSVTTNQLDDQALTTLVQRVNSIMTDSTVPHEPLMVEQQITQDSYLPTHLWYDATVDAMRSARETAVSQIVDTVQRQQGRGSPFGASGYVGLMAKATSVLTDGGITAFSDETDCEVSVTARPADLSVSGWSGYANRDWTKVEPARVAAEAADIAARSVGVQAVEPGRRTAILAPGAVVQLMRFLVPHFDGYYSDHGETGFSKVPGQYKGSRWAKRIFDSSVQISIDPADPDGGFTPWYQSGLSNPAMTLIDQGVLKNLCYTSFADALYIGKPYSDVPHGLRFHGGTTSLEQMIAQCEEGIYVNRISSPDVIDMRTGMMTGITSDGCFLIKNGKFDRPVKNFRFLTSPFFFLNTLVTLGPTHRAAFGYAPPTVKELEVNRNSRREIFDWPRRPMIVPPMMVRDFNFSQLVDAV